MFFDEGNEFTVFVKTLFEKKELFKLAHSYGYTWGSRSPLIGQHISDGLFPLYLTFYFENKATSYRSVGDHVSIHRSSEDGSIPFLENTSVIKRKLELGTIYKELVKIKTEIYE